MKPKRRRVLFLVPSLAGGGAERIFSMLLFHLDRSRFEPHLAVLQAIGEYRQDIPKDVVLHDLKVSRIRYALPSMIRLVWRINPDTILCTLGHLNLALIFAKPFFPSGTKLVVRESTIASALLKQETRYPRIWGWLYRHLYRRADKVVCSSDTMVNDLMKHFKIPREKIVRIYNPVDAKRVQELAQIGENPFRGPGPHLITVGRLSGEKGLDLLLEAMPEVREVLPTAELNILGQGPLLECLLEHAKKLGLAQAIHFWGFQQNPWRYMLHADVLVLPSRFEGLPNVLLEALTLRKRVVATDCPSAVREVQDSGGGMVLVPPDAPKALAEGIISVCKMLHEPGRPETNSEVGLRKFDLQQAVGEYSELLLS
jgi:glycosyltransferase involved in cell wall biosynthesis